MFGSFKTHGKEKKKKEFDIKVETKRRENPRKRKEDEKVYETHNHTSTDGIHNKKERKNKKTHNTTPAL